MRSQSIVKAKDGVMSTELDGQAVLMHVEQGTYFGLNDVGALIWKKMSEPVSVETLIEAVLSEFDVDAETCRCDVTALIEQFHGADLAEIVEADE